MTRSIPAIVALLLVLLMQLAAIALVCISVMIADEENRVERMCDEMRRMARGEVVK